jgi:cytoskeletal protein CcmA (bactofilin family)
MEHQKEDEKELPENPFESTEFVNYLGPGNVVEGKFSFKGRTLLKGSTVSGKITASDNETEIYVGPETHIRGDLKGNRVVFGGVMDGTIDAPRLVIARDGVFSGDISTDRGLSVEEGARLSAQISMKTKKATRKR